MSDIQVYVTSSLTSSERRISPQWDLHYLKQKIELVTGIQPQFQTIQYYPAASNDCRLLIDAKDFNEVLDQSTRVSELGLSPYGRLHIIDTDPDSDLKDLDNSNEEIPEFTISEEEYAKRGDSVLNWKQKNQLGRFDPAYNQERANALERDIKISSEMNTGDRCRIINIQGERRGTIRYLGKIEMLDEGESIWVGIEFDEPLGRNDGLINGHRLFQCKQKHGSFVKPKQVEVGDFPELDPFSDDDEL
ncbi:uncharacterized protein PRCAT00002234001 [Priceomyces carsonii]|uniref:uncharacterized protein n=1 Tax=Priceomyces carsonii TaxID=28549 RepID=UPI002ED969D3|nr:unnamed protein product [Priceomyces carsonii]